MDVSTTVQASETSRPQSRLREAVDRDARLNSEAWSAPPPPPPPKALQPAGVPRPKPTPPPAPAAAAPGMVVIGRNGGGERAAPPPSDGGSFAELQAKLDDLNNNIRKRSVAGTGLALAAAGRFKGSGSGRLALPVSEPKAARRASSRGGGSLQWEGTKSYVSDRRGYM